MARFARIVVRDYPHDVTARGNRGEPIFFEDADHEIYRDLLCEQCARRGVEIHGVPAFPANQQAVNPAE